MQENSAKCAQANYQTGGISRLGTGPSPERSNRQEQIEKSIYDLKEAVEGIETLTCQLCAAGIPTDSKVREKSIPSVNISSLLSDLPVIIGQLATRIRETRNILSDGLL